MRGKGKSDNEGGKGNHIIVNTSVRLDAYRKIPQEEKKYTKHEPGQENIR